MKKLKWNRFCTIFVLLMFITVTYASFNTNLFINGKGYVRVDKDIRITNIRLLEVENNGYENVNSEYSVDSVSMDVSLPKQASSVTYEATISNVSDKRYKITDILESSYNNKDVKYELVDASIGNIVEPHTTKTFKVRFTNNIQIVEEDDVYETKVYTFDYTGGEQEFVVPYDGTYKIELWGASGGGSLMGGKLTPNDTALGGYVSGEISLKKNKKIYLYVGGKGTDAVNGKNVSGGYNGGGRGTHDGTDDESSGGGGGATDIRLAKGPWNDFDSLKSRIMVAAGGAGKTWQYIGVPDDYIYGKAISDGYGGGLSGFSDYTSSPGTQTSGYKFGIGEDSPIPLLHHNEDQSGAGGGYYGGTISRNHASGMKRGAAGGSSYISGHEGCDAIKEESTEKNIIHTGQSVHYSGYQFSNTKMIDGGGYNWTTEKGTEVIGMPTHDGSSTMTGNNGNGYARITLTRKVEDGTDFDFDYTGGEQTFTAPYTGLYKLETWGAQGGSQKYSLSYGGYGGYSTGNVHLNKDETLYINIGGEGNVSTQKVKSEIAGGYNGGGIAYAYTDKYVGSGGGATHIAKSTGLLNTFETNKEQILIVSGGGGGGSYQDDTHYGNNGSGGGFIGKSGESFGQTGVLPGDGGTQTNGGLGYNGDGSEIRGSFGIGATPDLNATGGGGGYYGGGSGKFFAGGGGGSGYIGNSLLTEKVMYCYNCEESHDESTKTVTTKAHSKQAKQFQAKEGNGYSRITLIKRTVNQTKLTLDFTFKEYLKGNEYVFSYTGDTQVFNVPSSGIYQLEVWGSAGAVSNWGGTSGKGGYSTGKIRLVKDEKLYVNVGGKSIFNGGGNTNNGAFGGGATSITTLPGELKEFKEKQDKILIIAGGGGGVERLTGGSGGGFKGADGAASTDLPNYGKGGTQELGGSGAENSGRTATEIKDGTFGIGGSGIASDGGAGGGGGFFGGGGVTYAGGAGGGSGYIGNSLLYDKVMYCYNCEESNEESTKTISTENISDTATSNYAKEGNGFAKITLLEEIPEYTFNYTGDVQIFIAPYNGIYKVELWGASGYDFDGKEGGKGAYTSGIITLSKNTPLYLYVGGNARYNAYNGIDGPTGKTGDPSIAKDYGAGGGGSTDVRVVKSTWDNFDSLKSRIMVAAGGGGVGTRGGDYGKWNGGDAGGLIGYDGIGVYLTETSTEDTGGYCNGASQIAGGHCYITYSQNNYYGMFGRTNAGLRLTGGSGYYAGAGVFHVSGSGGSSYISGHTGCVSITKDSTEDNITFADDSNGIACNDTSSSGYNESGYNTDSLCNKHYSGYTFTDTKMIDGKGYSWDENGVGSEVVGIPSHDGRSTMIGNTGNGYAKIILIEKNDTYNINYDLDGGTISKPKKSFSMFDEDFTLKTPTKEGYTFLGWIGGKNLFNKEEPNESTVYINQAGTILGKSPDDRSIYVKIKPNTDYVITYPTNISRFRAASVTSLIGSQRKDMSGVNADGKNIIKIKTGPDDKYLYVNFPISCTLSDYYDGLQIEEGTEATSYEAYNNTRQKNLVITNGSQYNRTYKAIWRDDSVLCRKATTLHTAPCKNTSGETNKMCTASGYANGDTITYGTIPTGNDYVTGDAFDCDVNGDGVFDSDKERFYYIDELSENSDYVSMIHAYYSYEHQPQTTSKLNTFYNNDNQNWKGPTALYLHLPTPNEWENVRLYNSKRQIYTQLDTTSTTGGALPIFEYSNLTSRIITYQEVKNNCMTGTIEGSYYYFSLAKKCEFLMENTSFDRMDIYGRTWGQFTETPSSMNNNVVCHIDSHGRAVSCSYEATNTHLQVKPVIEVPKSKIK